MECAGIGGGDSEDGDSKEKDEEAERERLEAIREAEDRRKEKHRKMEEEREKMRQDIRDKVRWFLQTFPLKKNVALFFFFLSNGSDQWAAGLIKSTYPPTFRPERETKKKKKSADWSNFRLGPHAQIGFIDWTSQTLWRLLHLNLSQTEMIRLAGSASWNGSFAIH